MFYAKAYPVEKTQGAQNQSFNCHYTPCILLSNDSQNNFDNGIPPYCGRSL